MSRRHAAERGCRCPGHGCRIDHGGLTQYIMAGKAESIFLDWYSE